jgi:hypothetical protein
LAALRPVPAAAGLAQTWAWYRDTGLVERAVDFGFEDALLATLGG